MIKRSTIWQCTLIGILVLSVCICIVSAAEKPSAPSAGRGLMSDELKNLTVKGYDVTDVQAALEGGNTTGAQILLDEFFKANPEARPTPPANDRQAGDRSAPKSAPEKPSAPAGRGEMSDELQNLTAKGYDVTEVQTLLANGNTAGAQTLLDEFFKANPEARPIPPVSEKQARDRQAPISAGEKPSAPSADSGRMTDELTNLTAQGYDVNEIQVTLESGDITNAQLLLDEFFKTNPDLRPTPPAQKGVSPVSDAEKPPTPPAGVSMIDELKNLTAQGYNVTEIEVKLENGDNTSAQMLLDEFFKANPGALPIPLAQEGQSPVSPAKMPPTPPAGVSMIDELKNLTAQGYDVTEIQIKLESGDMTSAQMLLDEFFKANPGALLAPPVT